MKYLKLLKVRFEKLLTDIDQHEIFVLAGSIAYTTGLAMAPFIIIMMTIGGLAGEGTRKEIVEQSSQLLGGQAGEAVKLVVTNAQQNPNKGLVSDLLGFIILTISASAIFSQLQVAFDKINDDDTAEKQSGILNFLKRRVFTVGLLLGFVFLAVSSLVVTTALTVIFPSGDGLLWKALSFSVNFLLFTLLFTLMFRFVPTTKAAWTRCAISGVCSSVFFNVGKALIGLYLGHAAIGSSYGAAGSMVVFLAWIYYTAITLLVSYEFTNDVILQTKNRK